MATSGTTAFTCTADQIIQYAMRKLAVLEPSATPPTDERANNLLALEMMVKSWITKGIKLWTIQDITLPLTSAQNAYNLGPLGSTTPLAVTMDKPMKLYQAYLRNTVASPNNDIPLNLISQEQYLRTGSKGSTGTPNSVYMEVLRDYSVAHLYTTPDLIASGIYQAHLLVQRPLQDVGAVTNNMDFPQEWLYALGWNLASELIEDYEVPEGKANRVMMKAAKYLQEVEDFDTEYNSVYMSPSQYRPSI